MMHRVPLLLGAGAIVEAQQAGTVKDEFHPEMPLQVCTTAGGCSGENTTITMDANWRWLHNVGGYYNCFDGGSQNSTGWNSTYCPDSDSCCKNCALDGVEEPDWSQIYGVNATDGGYNLGLVQGGNVGSRFYLLNGDKYRMFNLKNKEFSFDVDVSTIGCGVNGALYFVEMPEDGGVADARLDLNKAGAKFGTGYCDAQCANDIKFIGGVANIEYSYGSCCAEVDIWEANNQATAYTMHPCSFEGQLRCEGSDCGQVCDHGGCDFNSYRNGVKDFFGVGSGFAVDTSRPVTVVTQFVTDDQTDTGNLVEVRRFYVQDGKKIANSQTNLPGVDAFDSITDDNCAAQKDAFGESNDFKTYGGMQGMSDAMDRGMVLVLSVWDDHAANMLWLDSVYPPAATGPGAERGPCATDSGDPSDVETKFADAYVGFTNIKFGEIGSTGGAPGPVPPSPGPAPAPTPASECCTWDGKYCGDTSDYCKATASQCADCGGTWCTDCLPPWTTTAAPITV